MDEQRRPLAALTTQVQKVSDLYAARFGINRDTLWHLSKMTEELGEVRAAFLNASGRGRERGGGDSDLGAELADLLAFVLLFARAEGIDLDAALERKWLTHLADNTN